MYKRNILDFLQRRMASQRVMILVGPRQCGKTTMVKLFGEQHEMNYVSFDDITNLGAAQFDPVGYLNQQRKPLVIDEAQRVPELFLPIKVDVDHHNVPGRYLLTGSANPLLVPKLGDALTGRMGFCHLFPLSQGELLGIKENFIEHLFHNKPWKPEYPSISKVELLNKISLGGFPAVIAAKTEEDRRFWCNDYLFNALQKDINELSKIEKFAQMPALFYGLANRVGSTLNMDELGRMTHTSSTTIRRYMQLLESLFLLYRLPSWSKNFDKRLVKSPKIYFTDTALLMHVLALNKEYILNLPHLLGHMAENFVIMEVVKQSTWSSEVPSLYHFRQERDGATEVDLVLETHSGKLAGIEIKIREVVRGNDLKGLTALKKHAKDSFYKGIVLYTGNKTIPFGDFWAVPITALWE